jgi:hypothetical protein
MAREQKAPQRKKYETPKLLVYGDLTEMTNSGGPRGQLDMVMGNSMT